MTPQEKTDSAIESMDAATRQVPSDSGQFFTISRAIKALRDEIRGTVEFTPANREGKPLMRRKTDE